MEWSWVSDITGTLNAQGIIEYLQLNELIRQVQCLPGERCPDPVALN